MARAIFMQKGRVLDYPNTGQLNIGYGDVLVVGGHIGIAADNIAVGEVGAVHMTGVFEIPKSGAMAIEMGADVYFDGEGITTAADNGETGDAKVAYTPAGYAAAAAAAGDNGVQVKLLWLSRSVQDMQRRSARRFRRSRERLTAPSRKR